MSLYLLTEPQASGSFDLNSLIITAVVASIAFIFKSIYSGYLSNQEENLKFDNNSLIAHIEALKSVIIFRNNLQLFKNNSLQEIEFLKLKDNFIQDLHTLILYSDTSYFLELKEMLTLSNIDEIIEDKINKVEEYINSKIKELKRGQHYKSVNKGKMLAIESFINSIKQSNTHLLIMTFLVIAALLYISLCFIALFGVSYELDEPLKTLLPLSVILSLLAIIYFFTAIDSLTIKSTIRMKIIIFIDIVFIVILTHKLLTVDYDIFNIVKNISIFSSLSLFTTIFIAAEFYNPIWAFVKYIYNLIKKFFSLLLIIYSFVKYKIIPISSHSSEEEI